MWMGSFYHMIINFVTIYIYIYIYNYGENDGFIKHYGGLLAKEFSEFL